VIPLTRNDVRISHPDGTTSLTRAAARVLRRHAEWPLVVPLTTRLVESAEPLRVRIRASGRLRKESDALIDQVRAIDNRRLVQGPLARLPAPHIDAVAEALLEVFDLADS